MTFTSRELAKQLLNSLNVANEARQDFIKNPNQYTADRCSLTMLMKMVACAEFSQTQKPPPTQSVSPH